MSSGTKKMAKRTIPSLPIFVVVILLAFVASGAPCVQAEARLRRKKAVKRGDAGIEPSSLSSSRRLQAGKNQLPKGKGGVTPSAEPSATPTLYPSKYPSATPSISPSPNLPSSPSISRKPQSNPPSKPPSNPPQSNSPTPEERTYNSTFERNICVESNTTDWNSVAETLYSRIKNNTNTNEDIHIIEILITEWWENETTTVISQKGLNITTVELVTSVDFTNAEVTEEGSGYCLSIVEFFWSIKDAQDVGEDVEAALLNSMTPEGYCIDLGLFKMCISRISDRFTVDPTSISLAMGAFFAFQISLCYCCFRRGCCGAVYRGSDKKPYEEVGFPIPPLPPSDEDDDTLIEGLQNMQSDHLLRGESN